MKDKTIGVGILGGTGYGAGELLRFLVNHSECELVSVTSSSQAGEIISKTHQHLSGFYKEKTFSKELDFEKLLSYKHQLIFASLPHGVSAASIAKLLDNPHTKNFKIIDLSGDFRLKNPEQQKKHYPDTETISSELKAKFVYGLTESNRKKITQAQYISNPGCLSSSAALAVLPLISSDFQGSIVFDAKTGTSGAGKNLAESLHHPTRHANLNAYKILEHRHEPEIREALGDLSGKRIKTIFVPHLLPVSRGIYTTAYLTLDKPQNTKNLQDLYFDFYKHSPFIRIKNTSPEMQHIIGTNFCDISIFARENQVVAIATLDNLVKGMVGQAIQNMNLMCGLEETTGLWYPGMGPF